MKETHKTLRIIELINSARRGEYPSIEKLATKFNAGIRTIKRDVRFVRTVLNCPLEYSKKEKGYFLWKPFSLDEVKI